MRTPKINNLLKFIYLTITSCIILSGCSNDQKESFEGIITYKISVTGFSGDSAYDKDISKRFGKEMKFYITKNGNNKTVYKDAGKMGYEYSIYNQKENKAYVKLVSFDTLISTDCSKNTLKFYDENNVSNETINNVICKGFYMTGIDSLAKRKVTLTYFYPEKNEFIDPLFYQKYKIYFYDKVIAKIKGPYYKMIMDTGEYQVTYELVNIEKKQLDKSIFDLSGIPVINYK
ncbi:MAG: hypothetical protein H7321_05495 [Bacteroidia bacterium]|nr:hypothetical protein [Bacteroidia bacterium]